MAAIIKPFEFDVLLEMTPGTRWYRPADLSPAGQGGRTRNSLARLTKRGLVERWDKTGPYHGQPSYLYHITHAGKQAILDYLKVCRRFPLSEKASYE